MEKAHREAQLGAGKIIHIPKLKQLSLSPPAFRYTDEIRIPLPQAALPQPLHGQPAILRGSIARMHAFAMQASMLNCKVNRQVRRLGRGGGWGSILVFLAPLVPHEGLAFVASLDVNRRVVRVMQGQAVPPAQPQLL